MEEEKDDDDGEERDQKGEKREDRKLIRKLGSRGRSSPTNPGVLRAK